MPDLPVTVLGVDIRTQKEIRDYFMLISHLNPSDPSAFFMGNVCVLDDAKALLKNLYVAFFHDDELYEGVEDHAWTFEIPLFKRAGVICGDNVAFYATILPYKRADGTADYSVKHIRELHVIEGYELPDSDELHQQYQSLMQNLQSSSP